MGIEGRERRSFFILAEQLHFWLVGWSPSLQHLAARAKQADQRSGEKIGGALLARNRRDVRLTPAGHFLYDEARRIVCELDARFDTAQAAARDGAERLCIAAGIASMHSLLPPTLRKCGEAHPKVAIQVGGMSTPRQIDALLTSEIDLGFPCLPIGHPPLVVRKVL